MGATSYIYVYIYVKDVLPGDRYYMSRVGECHPIHCPAL